MFRRDVFRGAICNHAERVHQTENEQLRVKISDNRKPTQTYIKSTTTPSKLDCATLVI
jgi:hypothetical protein